MAKSQYKTKQMAQLLTYLKTSEGHVTVNDIRIYFAQQGIAVGTTTIYRNLEKLVKEGLVAKYTVDTTSSACFEYVGEKTEEKGECSYHCKCEKCGKLIHLQCHEVEDLRQHMSEHHGFQMDSQRAVFYGMCSECKE